MFTPPNFIGAALPSNRPQRRLIAVDIENVIGGGSYSVADAWKARLLIERHIGPTNGEIVIIGTSHVGMFSSYYGWWGARHLIQSGPDGADLQLIAELQQPDVTVRFNEVVLVSGDGIFLDTVVNLTSSGATVTVLAPADGCSKRLQLAASNLILFDRPEHDERSAA